MSELISIVVPCYNAEKTIDRCVKSVIDQTYAQWELIIVDDGSNDNSAKYIHKWCARDNRIIFYSQSNAGVSSARNKAMELVKGSYLAFLDSDDWYAPCFLQELYDKLKSTNADMACCAYRIDSLEKGHDVISGKGDTVFYGKECLQQILFGISVRGFMCNKIFKTSIIKNFQFRKELKLCEDMYLLCEAYSEEWVMAYVDKALYHYWIDGTGATQSENVMISVNGGIQALDTYKMMKNLFREKEKQLYFVRLSGDTIINMFQSGLKLEKYREEEIWKQIREIRTPYFWTNTSIKNKIKFILILLKMKKVWRKENDT